MRWNYLLLVWTGCASVSVVPPTDPELIELQAVLGNTHVPAQADVELVARLRIRGSEMVGGARPPVNLGLLIDTSGSMSGDAIEDARNASQELLRQLRPGDRLSVVAFHSDAEVLLPSTEVDPAHLADMAHRIQQMQAHGTTNLTAGLQLALEQLSAHWIAEGINRLVLLSDGVPNNESTVRPMVAQFASRQLAVTALGLGNDYNEVLLGEIATQTGGRFHDVAESQAVAQVFREEVLRLQQVVARNLALMVTPGPGVRIESVIGATPQISGRALALTFGQLAAGEHRDIFVRMRVNQHRPGAAVEVLDARLQFHDAVASAGTLQREVYLGARATNDIEQLEAGRNAEVEQQANEMQAAAIAIEVLRQARYGQLDQAENLLIEAEETMGEQPIIRDLGEVVPRRRSRRSRDAAPAPGAPEPPPMPERRVREIYDSAMDSLGY